MASVVHDVWNLAWSDVKKSHASLLAKAKLQVDSSTWCSETELRAFIDATQNENYTYRDKKNGTRSKLTKFIKAVHKSTGVIDLVVPKQPFEVALLWGTGRLIFLIAANDIAVAEQLAEALTDVLPHIKAWNLEAQTFASDSDVQDSLRKLFSDIIVLLVSARIQVKTPKIKRVFQSTFSSNIEDNFKSIERRTKLLDHRLRQASTFTAAQERSEQGTHRIVVETQLETITGTTERIEDKLQVMLDPISRSMGQYNAAASNREAIISWLRRGVCALDDVPDPAQDTCEWIYEVDAWKAWQQISSRKCLFISGLPGAGKSVLARSIARRIRATSNAHVLYYPFQSTTAHFMAGATGFAVYSLYTLLRQPLVTDNRCFPWILDQLTILTHRWNNVRTCPAPRLLEILDKVFEMMSDLLVVVDALDECFSEDIPSMLEYLSHKGTQPCTRVIIFAREHLLSDRHLQRFVHICVDLKLVRADIERFVDQEIGSCDTLKAVKEDAKKNILEHSQGIFLSATLMLDAIKKEKTPKRQKSTMAKFANTLPGIYEQLLKSTSEFFTAEELTYQREIFLIVVAAKDNLTPEEVYQYLIMDTQIDIIDPDDMHVDPASEIVRLCQPLIKIGRQNTVQLIHVTAKEFLLQRKLTREESDLYLARKTLSQLTQDYYRQWKTSAALLRRHILAETQYSSGQEGEYDEKVLYKYAVQHFQEHVTALNKPPLDVVAKLARFLQGIEFVSWSEVLFELNLGSGLGAQVLVYRQLLKWMASLDPETQNEIPIKDFFEKPHLDLSEILKNESQDKLLQYLPFVRLGEYYNVSGQTQDEWRKAFVYKTELVSGVTKILGARSPVTLRFRDSMLREYFWQKRFDEVYIESLEVAQIQEEVLGSEALDIYVTLEMVAGSLVCLTRFDESLPIFDRIARGIQKLRDDSCIQFLMNEFFQAQAWEQLRSYKQAASLYEDILAKWVPKVGKVSPLGLMAQAALGSVQRKQEKHDLAEKNLLEAYGGRKELFSINNNVCLDSAVQLALEYRDIGKFQMAMELLDSVSDSQVYEEDFERYCQTMHLRALVKLDTNEYEPAKRMLMALLNKASGEQRNKNNRELLWVRCTLADALRQKGEGDDAPLLFDNLVEAIQPPSSPESQEIEYLETPRQLDIAERALRLVREAKLAKASQLLEANGLRWFRDKDFWILGQGGPIPDTAIIRPIDLSYGRSLMDTGTNHWHQAISKQ